MTTMNRLTKQCLAFAAGLTAFFFVLGIAGRYEYAEQVVYNMPQTAYENIYLQLGDGCTQVEIADEYLRNRQYWDSISAYE